MTPFLQVHRQVHLQDAIRCKIPTLRGLDGVPIKTGGVEDHVHMVWGLKPVHRVSDLVRELKKASSVWAGREHDREFQWQEGYSAFSVDARGLDDVVDYVARQEEHHRALTFEDELKGLLERHRIAYDPTALF